MAAYRRVYDSRHLQADCQEAGSAPEPYARQSSMGYTTLARHLATDRVTSTRYMNRVNSRRITKLTGVDESPGSAFAELLRFVGQRYFYDARDMSRRCVHLYGVRRQQLQHRTSPSRRRSSSYHTNTRGRRDDMPPPPMAVLLAADLRPSADGSAVRTSLVAGQLQAASVPIA